MASAWHGSTRRARLPMDWPAIRQRIRQRDGYRCTWTHNGMRCVGPADQVDHIINNDDDNDNNLRSLCYPHHQAKSSREGAAARHAIRQPRDRPTKPHPGRL